jgi:hypothetical protein
VWHAVFYSGFSATAGWVLWTCRRALHNGHAPLLTIPVGYGPTVIAVAVFAAAAFGDLAWHTIFGIEQSITILFSPTHLVLVAAMITIVTTPIRSMWADDTVPAAPGLRRLLPVLLSTAFVATLVLLFMQAWPPSSWFPRADPSVKSTRQRREVTRRIDGVAGQRGAAGACIMTATPAT